MRLVRQLEQDCKRPKDHTKPAGTRSPLQVYFSTYIIEHKKRIWKASCVRTSCSVSKLHSSCRKLLLSTVTSCNRSLAL